MFRQFLGSYYDELEKIGEGPTTVVVSTKQTRAKEKPSGKLERMVKGFAAGSLPTAAGVRYLIPVKTLEKPGWGLLHPATHSKLQTAAGLGAGILGAAIASKRKKSPQVMIQL
jgi:hypothetical protein